MKGRLLALLFLLVFPLSLCACAPDTGTERLRYETKAFSMLARGSFDDTQVAFRLHHDADGTLTLSFCDPSAFLDLTYTVYPKGEASGSVDLAPRGVRVAYDGIEIPLSAGDAPCAIMGVAQAFSMRDASMTACKIAKSTEKERTDTELSFSCEAGTATLLLHGEHGLPCRLEAQLYDVAITLDFSEWEYAEVTP